MTTDLTNLSLEGALEHLRTRKISPTELVEAHIEKINKLDLEINSYVYKTFDQAREKAKLSEARYLSNSQKPLDGIPVGIKDMFCTKGIRTTACSRMLENFVPPYESTVSLKLQEEAGAISLGKLNCDEFAMGSANLHSYFGPSQNPIRSKSEPNKILTAGGSSGGSAASVASFMAMASLGTDTGGSIRQPAAFTGLYGIKPTYGRCSRYGMIAFASSLDQAGVFARTTKDAALVLENIMGRDENDFTTANKLTPNLSDNLTSNIKGLKIGVPVDIYNTFELDPEIKKMWDNTIQTLKDLGAQIMDITLPNAKYAVQVYYITAPAEASSNLSRYDGVRFGYRTNKTDVSLDELYTHSRTEGFGLEVKSRILIGTYVLSSGFYDAYYTKAQKVRRLIANDFYNNFEKVDVILLPTTPNAAFGLKDKLTKIQMYMNDILTIPASLAGLPCMSVPCAINKDGLPLGMQIIGKMFDEQTILNTSFALEKALKIHA
jgi:aspartyl-tRNA(Asn)/glutamyl-tRNA(Gln) amidotransferase subunit A